MTLSLGGVNSEIKILFWRENSNFGFFPLGIPSSRGEKHFLFYSKNSVVSQKTEKNAVKNGTQ